MYILGIDPEFPMKDGSLGEKSAQWMQQMLTSVAEYLAKLVKENNLPLKFLSYTVLHKE